MLKEDFLLRMIQEVMKALTALLNKKGSKLEKQQELENFYSKYLNKDKDFFLTQSIEDIHAYLDQSKLQEKVVRIELLAEILYHDALLSSQIEEKRNLALKACYLFEELTRLDKTFSVERQLKTKQLMELANVHN
ncbi:MULTISPECIES: hypothetical protein [Bacteroides]|uniref:hypothetical protein n=1 Tax=Bacteroides TaxID=816 RepID=UPI001DA064A1|nr:MULTISPECIES: hypothetical protein [Bacteroides]HJD93057.1 hypothetical protein [Bacteroides coprosuis]